MAHVLKMFKLADHEYDRGECPVRWDRPQASHAAVAGFQRFSELSAKILFTRMISYAFFEVGSCSSTGLKLVRHF